MRRCLAFIFSAMVIPVFAKQEFVFDYASNRVERSGWVNLDEAHHLSGHDWSPESITNRTVVVHRWCKHCPGIGAGIRAFNDFSKKHPELICMTSYYPGAPDPKDQVMRFIKDNKVKTPVYTGASHINAHYGKDHRALYIVTPSGEVPWEVSENGKDQVSTLTHEFKKHYEDCLLAEMRLTLDPNRKKQLKDVFKKLYPKSTAKLKDI